MVCDPLIICRRRRRPPPPPHAPPHNTNAQHDCAGERPTASPATHTDLDQHESTVFTTPSYVRPLTPSASILAVDVERSNKRQK